MARGKRMCFVCGQEYNYCPNCGRGDARDTWKYLYCSDNCRTVEHIWEDCFRDKDYSKEEAAEKLMDCDISRLEFYRDQIRDDMTEIAVMAGMVPESEDEEDTPEEETEE